MNDTKEERKGWLKGRGKLFNFRPVLAISSGFGLGIFLCYAFSLHALWIGLLLAVGGGGAICLFLRKKEKSALPALLFAAFLLLMFCLGALSFSARLSSYNADNAAEGTYTVSATVKDIAGKNSLYLTDAMLTDGDSVRALGGNIRVYVNSLPDEIGIGTKVSFECELKPYDSSAYGRFNATPILENTKYMASVSGDKIMVRGEKKFDLFYAARERLRNVLFGTMREEEAAVCYAMLTGDGSAVENGLLQNFRYGGVAHIFAVSGLHIGVIYAILSFLLKRIRMPKLLRCALIFAPLLFYVGVCRFSPSSVRALVMCTILMFSNAAGLKYDALNSVSLAALAVLIINPVYLFGVGFLLSIAAAGGIIVLGGTFTRAFQKIRCPRKLASSAGVCLAAQISTFPLLLDCFGYVSALSLVTNLLFIPVISAVYALLFAFSLLACVIPAAAGALLYIPELLVSVAVFPLSALDMKILLISGFSFGGYIALWYFVLAVMSDKINLRAAPKAAVCLLLSAVLICGVAAGNGAFETGNVVFLSGDYNASFVYIRSDGDYLVCFGKPSAASAQSFSLRYRLKGTDGLIVLGSEKEINAAVPVMQAEIPAKTLYAAERGDYQQSFHSLEVKNPQGEFYLGTARMRFIDENTLFAEVCGARYLFAGKDAAAVSGEYDVAVSAKEDGLDGVRAKEKICFESASDKISVRHTGDLQIRAKDGIIFVKRRGA